jgi:exodeoxyribonuclease III
MKIISWNVNGIRAVYKKGFPEWFATESPDILCLQEIKASIDQFPPELFLSEYEVYHSSSQTKGRSGVATFSRQKFLDTQKFHDDLYDSEGRVLIHECEQFFLVNAYFPNGSRDHKRVPFKLKFCEDMLTRINQLKKLKPVIITGDFNTAHNEIDLANPKTNQKTTGFLPEERAWIDKLISQGWIDIFRKLHPHQKDAYTWWTQRSDCRERNIGWRLDYFFISPELKSRVKRAEILHQVKGSDHCPVLLELSRE